MQMLSLFLSHSHTQVQSKVNLKYDSWHREIVSKFGGLLGQNMQEFHTTIAKARLCLLFRSNVLHVRYALTGTSRSPFQ